MRAKLLGPSLTALFFAIAYAPTVAAQEETPAAPPVAEGALVEEIIVTARQRAENLQDVPLAISAFNSEQLEARGATSLNDIATLTPGLNFEAYANGGYPVITIRGLSATSILAFEGNVATFYGGVYLPRAYMVDTGLIGLERVEVVKGPQSALYGRNAFAGAINYVPVSPPSHLTVEAFTTVGTNDRFDYGATLGGPIIADKVEAIAGYAYSTFDGTWTNAHPNRLADANGTTDRMGGWENVTWFGAVDITPIDALRVTLGWNHTEKDTEAQGRYNISRNTGDGNCSLVGGVYQFYCGELPVLESVVDPRSQGLHADSDLYRVEAEYRLTDDITAYYLYGRFDSTAYSYDQTSINSINGDSPAGVQFLGLPVGSINGDSHEARLSFDNGPTKAAAGVFTSSTTDDYRTMLVFRPPLGTEPITPDEGSQIIAQNSGNTIDTRSVFATLSQDFLGGDLNVSVEGRYTEEEKSINDRVSQAQFSETFDYFTPRAVVQYDITPDSNVYASVAKGVKSGGFNGGNILESERTFEPEENWTYELGTKNRLFDRRLQLNANVYYVDWSNLQTLSLSGNTSFLGTITRNVGAATAYGFEVDALARITSGLQAGLSYAYTNPRYGDDLVDPRYLLMLTATRQPILICDDITCPSDGSIGGNLLPRQSQHQATATVQYRGDMPTMDGAEFSIGGDVSYKSKQYVDPLLLTWAPARTLVNLNGSLSRGNVRLELFVKNVFDEKYAASATYNLTGNTQVRYEGVLGERRTFGATLRYKY